MALSEIWHGLPRELVEQILTHHVDSHWEDPAYTWVRLRHLSSDQKHRIERHFESSWLPKLNITLYYHTRDQFEYSLVQDKANRVSADGKATFVFVIGPNATDDTDPKVAWDDYSVALNRNITVRLGESWLSGGCKGGYILNDTDLPGLEVLDDGRRIRFCWKGAMDELLREEMYMRRVGEELVRIPKPPL